MAVYAAHLTRTLSGKPSIFEITAQEALGSTVKPAFRKVFEYLEAVYPDRFGWSVRWYDELFLVLDGLLQYHYLKHYSASFAESFYGLVRAPVSMQEFSSGARLPAALEAGSWLMLVVLPYLRDKADALAERWREMDEDGLLGKSTLDAVRRGLVRLHSALHVLYESYKLCVLARYLAGAGRAASPPLQSLGLLLAAAPPPPPAEPVRWGDLLMGRFSVNAGAMGALVLRGMEWGAFWVLAVRWWQARGGATVAARALPTPPPPPPQTQNEEAAETCRNKCPICLQPWRIPTALPVSGYVFCYTCISRHVRAHGACPLTMLPAREERLVRLYLQ